MQFNRLLFYDPHYPRFNAIYWYMIFNCQYLISLQCNKYDIIDPTKLLYILGIYLGNCLTITAIFMLLLACTYF